MAAGLVICAIVLAICTVIVLVVVHNDVKESHGKVTKEREEEDNVRTKQQ